ncbi:MAG: hypothetical protein A6F70_02055 [Cycloclasticus sp. symbiont of Bathymodiolus heckerae]|nr:MAG: hypothetical protein A6F70_02055 [Cycloclasticus sp. symbiont of Bathymodiolus heckerae]
MKYLKRLFIFLLVLTIAYCNIPLTKHTRLEIDVKGESQDIKFTFLNKQDEVVSFWEQKNNYFSWYNEMGYNGNGPDLSVDKILLIKKIIISSRLCIAQTISVEFTKEYSPQNYTKYLHHGSKAHMQYSFKRAVSLECDNNALKK